MDIQTQSCFQIIIFPSLQLLFFFSFTIKLVNLKKYLHRKMRGKKVHSKKIEEKMPLPGNRTLLDFVKVQKPIENGQKIKEPEIHVPRYIKIPNSSGYTAETYPQDPVIVDFDRQLKLYPRNPELRDYQFKISMECIKFNTLVCLPTGLGKTHIASILIMNFMRWFPGRKIFFLAPTRPLVRQQRQSLRWFYEEIGVENVFEMNGLLGGEKRKMFYQQKRVFFSTPQTFANDLKQGRLKSQWIKLIIFDQAHRAVGNSAYAQSIRFLNKNSTSSAIRIIGLSATPGNQKDKIQEVISNLNISKMIYKDEEEPDVKKYFYNRFLIPIIIQPPSIIQEALSILDQMAIPYLKFLISLKMADPWLLKSKINSGLFFVVFQTFQQRKTNLDQSNSQFAFSSLRILKFLIDSKTDLLSHGYETFKCKFFRHIQDIVLQEDNYDNQNNQKGGQSSKLSKNSKNSHSKLPNQSLPKKFKQKTIQSQSYKRIKQLFNPKSNAFNHPKLQKLRQILEEFFKKQFIRLPSGKLADMDKEAKASNSKCIVFTNLRSTAFQIKTYLSNSEFIRAQMFHGQSKTQIYEDHYNDMGEYENSKQSTLVLNQKQQISIIDRFKKGDINTLIATSIGEEGLDIGEVDCIVCYDGGNKSPIRSIQRFGRTGRKRDGYVYVLLMKGTEENDYKKGQEKIKSMKKMLKNGEFSYYGYNVSLLKEQSQVKVQLYDNQMVEAPKTQKKQKRGRKKKEEQKEESDSSQETSFLKEQLQQTSKNQMQENTEEKKDGTLLSNSEYLGKVFQRDPQETCYIHENVSQFMDTPNDAPFLQQKVKNMDKKEDQGVKLDCEMIEKKTKSKSERQSRCQKSKCKETKKKSALKGKQPKSPHKQSAAINEVQKIEQIISQQFEQENIDLGKRNEEQVKFSSQKINMQKSQQNLRKSHLQFSSKLIDMFEGYSKDNERQVKQVDVRKKKLGLMLQEFFQNEKTQYQRNAQRKISPKVEQSREKGKMTQMQTRVKQELLNDLFSSETDEDSSLNSSEILDEILANNSNKLEFN